MCLYFKASNGGSYPHSHQPPLPLSSSPIVNNSEQNIYPKPSISIKNAKINKNASKTFENVHQVLRSLNLNEDQTVSDGLSLAKVTQKVSVNGVKMMSDGELLVFLPSLLMVLNYNDILMGGQREKRYVSSKFVETQSMHYRKPMHIQLQ